MPTEFSPRSKTKFQVKELFELASPPRSEKDRQLIFDIGIEILKNVRNRGDTLDFPP